MVDQAAVSVRSLQASDVRVVARVLGPQIKNLPADAKSDPGEIGRSLISKVLSDNMDDLWAWLADMAGMSPDQLDEQPLETPLLIIEKVMEDEHIGPFGERLRKLLPKDTTQSGTG